MELSRSDILSLKFGAGVILTGFFDSNKLRTARIILLTILLVAKTPPTIAHRRRSRRRMALKMY